MKHACSVLEWYEPVCGLTLQPAHCFTFTAGCSSFLTTWVNVSSSGVPTVSSWKNSTVWRVREEVKREWERRGGGINQTEAVSQCRRPLPWGKRTCHKQ